jgi:predicted CXXCH cytochrome family protein
MWSNPEARRLTRRVIRAAVAAVIVACAVAVAAPARAQDEAKFHLKPGAAGRLCLGCHVEFQDIVKKPFVHTPVKSGQCAGCHSPHAADHGKLLADSPDAVCATCHGAMVPAGAKSAHDAVAEGRCVSCHDPHASPNKANLIRAGNDLCLGCHAEMKSSLESATHRHAPVDRNCLGCHDPHASKDATSLLVKASPSLCLDCHKATQPGFAQAHMGYPVAAADCTSCHDPHGSGNRGILWANVHQPVLNRMCSQCHGEPARGQVTVKRAGSDLCRGCHNDLMLEIGSKNRVHWPLLDKAACGNCHEPHASRTAKLLAAPQKQLCGSCHPDSLARQDRSVTKHPPVNEGECSVCHSPHASDATFLLATADDRQTCGTCHDWSGHSAHPIGESAVDQRNPNLRVTCESCHRSHGTAFKHFAHGDVKGELCMQCHTWISR